MKNVKNVSKYLDTEYGKFNEANKFKYLEETILRQ